MTDCHFLNLNIWLQKDSIQKVREYYKESNDIDGTLKQLPRHLVAERAIVSSEPSTSHLMLSIFPTCYDGVCFLERIEYEVPMML